MGAFVRAVVYGFGFSLGAALFKRVSEQVGLSDKEPADTSRPQQPDTDPDHAAGEPATNC